MAKVLLTRPHDQSQSLTQKLAVHDLETLIAPMLEIESMVASIPPLQHAQGLIFCSPSAVTMFDKRCSENGVEASEVPAFCVGQGTKTMAENCGFKTVISADGDAKDLMRLILTQTRPDRGVMVHVRGADVTKDFAKLLLKYGYQTESTVIYNARTADSVETAAMNAMYAGEIGYVMFFSTRTAQAFVTLAKSQGFAAAAPQMTAICMSDQVAEAARIGVAWRSVRVAHEPNENAMIETLRDAVSALGG
ncbi:MAG: hypothetical protein CL558_06300 [Alphaproteobacteria bacterium]|nr:hypothetical protein [Alphaproteobacteria bacterium]MAS47282.1 hypothetical protein [Alphaproteobacteria bacterium]MAX95375.1 hypothetical protein [Alphaproteobacteria bacterium]MBN53171.1 hypothetical protein [Alphaproteobacteria bacterium]OUT41204.1 MAG: hypothetical protein CBB62_02265 [Micavibrio sp. TMED2]|tara:strand:+ start:1797 stop:2543 length:747 start_codon:yes stop_codon:yes gene_type:complete